MTIKELLEVIKKEDVEGIDFEDYYGNTLFSLKDVDIADVEFSYIDKKNVLRLQKIKSN